MVKKGDYYEKKNSDYIFSFIMCIVVFFLDDISIKTRINMMYGLNVYSCNIEEKKDEHCLNGDGLYYFKVDCSNRKINSTFDNWKKLPLGDNLKDELSSIYYSSYFNYSNDPNVQEGFYYFIDRHSEAVDIHDEVSFYDRYSVNYTLIIFDSDKKLFIIMK